MFNTELLFFEMLDFFRGDAKRIAHLIKVHDFARHIGIGENLGKRELEILESAAYIHDCGIKQAEGIYGYNNGKLQEEYGKPCAKEILSHLGADEELTERVVFLVGHHHTYKNITSKDYQILVESDFLVNLYEDNASKQAIKNAYEKIFVTDTGKKIFKKVYSDFL